MVPAAAPDGDADVGDHVLRRPRRKHRVAAPLARAPRRPGAVRRPAASPRAARCRTGRAGAGGKKRAPFREHARSIANSSSSSTSSRAASIPNTGRWQGAGNANSRRGPVDAIIGFPAICTHLRGTRHARGRACRHRPQLRRARWNSQSSGARASRVPGCGQDWGALPAFTAPGGTWEMKDISASGFRLHAPMGAATELTLNTLVAIRRRDQEAWVLGISPAHAPPFCPGGGDRTAADRELAGRTPISCEQRKAREADYSVNGEIPTDHGARVPGSLPFVQPTRGRAAGAVLDRSRRRVPRVQALHAPDGGFATHDPVRARARTSCGLGLDRRRSRCAPGNRLRRVLPRHPAA